MLAVFILGYSLFLTDSAHCSRYSVSRGLALTSLSPEPEPELFNNQLMSILRDPSLCSRGYIQMTSYCITRVCHQPASVGYDALTIRFLFDPDTDEMTFVKPRSVLELSGFRKRCSPYYEPRSPC
ncbi:hypothetical protein BDR06DRAFT_319367 [Suillus hirtellus]|nr:hypothetical protein BDR06DRAFT_319367 [Suillus hirtellus]